MNIHTTMQELVVQGIITDSLYDYCLQKKIYTIYDLFAFHKRMGTFLNVVRPKKNYKEIVYLYSRFKKIEGNEAEKEPLEILDISPASDQDLPSKIKLNTSTDELFLLEKMSRKTLDLCANYRLFSVNDILHYDHNDRFYAHFIIACNDSERREIEDILNECGKWENYIIEQGMSIAKEYKEFSAYLWTLIQEEVSSATQPIKDYFSDLYPSAERYYAEMLAKQGNIFQTVDKLSTKENLELFGIYKSITRKILNWYQRNMFVKNIYINCFHEIQNSSISELEEKETILYYETFSDEKKNLIDNKYKTYCLDNLSVRAKKAQALHFDNVKSILHWFYGLKEDFVLKYAHTKRNATFEELFDSIQRFKPQYDTLAAFQEEHIESKKVGNEFPFLLSFQREFVIDFQKNRGYYPSFFLLLQYCNYSGTHHLHKRSTTRYKA